MNSCTSLYYLGPRTTMAKDAVGYDTSLNYGGQIRIVQETGIGRCERTTLRRGGVAGWNKRKVPPTLGGDGGTTRTRAYGVGDNKAE